MYDDRSEPAYVLAKRSKLNPVRRALLNHPPRSVLASLFRANKLCYLVLFVVTFFAVVAYRAATVHDRLLAGPRGLDPRAASASAAAALDSVAEQVETLGSTVHSTAQYLADMERRRGARLASDAYQQLDHLRHEIDAATAPARDRDAALRAIEGRVAAVEATAGDAATASDVEGAVMGANAVRDRMAQIEEQIQGLNRELAEMMDLLADAETKKNRDNEITTS
ncbi:hypothetical protein Pelo_10062 [Pelomyxa schiedti]|nr:hypothetical protein Pelo_10062 [Pelomyxa schiedti]